MFEMVLSGRKHIGRGKKTGDIKGRPNGRTTEDLACRARILNDSGLTHIIHMNELMDLIQGRWRSTALQ
jgi:hypothetical protein